jgi:hypothetical protein
MISGNYKLSSMNGKVKTHSSITSFSWMRPMVSRMCFGTLQASKANTNVTRKNSILCGQEMADHYIEEKLLTITVIGGEND